MHSLKYLRHWEAKLEGLENQSLWQGLNSYGSIIETKSILSFNN